MICPLEIRLKYLHTSKPQYVCRIFAPTSKWSC